MSYGRSVTAESGDGQGAAETETHGGRSSCGGGEVIGSSMKEVDGVLDHCHGSTTPLDPLSGGGTSCSVSIGRAGVAQG
jgi:hypothetical protein